MRARLVPHPLLTLLIALVFVFLMNEATPGVVVLGLVLGFVIPLITAPFWPGRPKLKAPLTILSYLVIVLWDIVVSNIEVAQLILFRPSERLRTRYVTVPLDLVTPEAIAVLAGTITMTPGTVSADLSADGKALLVHCLDAGDPEGAVATMKARYESRLKRIFE
ncbi:Na+/H+ antiporter subunit E [Aquabacter sediminis]|uniref:Na+/H+ antiporter subunit E n=1 Tax=Aquabacter sediminis TaxID=3029197 RepID=UPI00237EC91C|nr:Na+/H+ antiporter subunit E [Aquabacter sp. P-9]MDE1567880.1 Na+/H+ antiporter subunit E [Aquabacter sp. P-9]